MEVLRGWVRLLKTDEGRRCVDCLGRRMGQTFGLHPVKLLTAFATTLNTAEL